MNPPGTDESITDAEDLLEKGQYEAAAALFTENLDALNTKSEEYFENL